MEYKKFLSPLDSACSFLINICVILKYCLRAFVLRDALVVLQS